LFVRADYQRREIAKVLVRVVINECKETLIIGDITVNSSPYAKYIYIRLGFEATGIEENRGEWSYILRYIL